jgi:D-sedoheptulose 7-phosphate isomerase
LEFIGQYLKEATETIARLDRDAIERLLSLLVAVRSRGGRVFVLGVGGSAANASHAANDFRKLAHIEAYAPTDNVAELTARTNDDGWDSTFSEWLRVSRLQSADAIFVLSVGGGSPERNVSTNLVRAVDYAKSVGAAVCGIVGRDGGYTASRADACVLVPSINASTVTPHAESFQAIVWHLLVSHPRLARAEAKWEGLAGTPRRETRGGGA